MLRRGLGQQGVADDGRRRRPLFKSLTTQDTQQALTAAAAVGDDAIQQKMGGQVNESAFTHGSSAQRQQWFNEGYTTGDPRRCDTFGNAL
ncbi:MAG TPA: neutral zinc metallopeptidase [Micromonosporaceae bacterium]